MKASDFKPKQLEHDIQVACVQWFRLQYPQALIWATPNGGQRNVVVAKKLKDEGVLAGVPDLQIPEPRGEYSGLFIEMKSGRNKPTSEQIDMMNRLRDRKFKCVVCWSFDEFMREVKKYLQVEQTCQ